jgi:hypothetical protein
MPKIKTDDGCEIYVEVEGPQHGPVLMLSNSLGTNLHMWDDQVPSKAVISAWCATIGAVMAAQACRRDPIRCSVSAAMCSR